MKRGPLIFDLKNYTQDVEETTEHYLIEDDYLKNEGKHVLCMYKQNNWQYCYYTKPSSI